MIDLTINILLIVALLSVIVLAGISIMSSIQSYRDGRLVDRMIREQLEAIRDRIAASDAEDKDWRLP